MSERKWSIGRLRGGLALVYYVDGRRHRHSLGTADPREAERLAPALYHELTRPKGTDVASLWKAYEDDHKGRAVVGTMRHTWKALASMFGPLEPETITVEHCRAHTAARRAAGIQDGTIHTELGHLRMVLLWAKKRRLFTGEVPAIERPPKPRPKEAHLTRRQARALIDAAAMPHVRLFVILALGTGARSAAILGLTWDRVDFESGLIDLRDPEMTMPHKGRALVPMNRTVRVALMEAREGALTRFVVEWAGKPVASVKRGLASAARTAGIPFKVSPHMLRHSAAVHMAEAGRPMDEIAQYLGHSDVSVTRNVYARFSPEYLRAAASVLEYDDLGSGEPAHLSRLAGKK